VQVQKNVCFVNFTVLAMALRNAASGQLQRSLRAAWAQQQSRTLVTQKLPDLPYDYRCWL